MTARRLVASAAAVFLFLPPSAAVAASGGHSHSASGVLVRSFAAPRATVAAPPPEQLRGRGACRRLRATGSHRVSVCVAGLDPLTVSDLLTVVADTGSGVPRSLLNTCSASAVADRFVTCATALGDLVVKRRGPAGTVVRRAPLAIVQIWRTAAGSLLIHHSVYIDELHGAGPELGSVQVTLAGSRAQEGHDVVGAERRHRLTPRHTSVWRLDDQEVLQDGAATSQGSGIAYLAQSHAGRAPSDFATVGPHAWRCNGAGADAGCVSPLAVPTLTLDANVSSALDLVARQIGDAQASGSPGAPGTSQPLQAVSASVGSAQSAADCAGLTPDGQFASCSVYPPVDSAQAGAADDPSVRALSSDATDAESVAIQSFMSVDHVLPGDRFYEAAQVRTDRIGPRIMIVGDSITEGHEGESTWRYRLWQELMANDVDATFVGPWIGTDLLEPLTYTGPTPPHDGLYRPGIDFDSANDAQWGWTLDAATATIEATVASYQPDVILVELGYNDLAFGVHTPAGLVDEVGSFVQAARAANPGVAIFVSNVVHRDPAITSAAIETAITTYDNDLPAAVTSMSTSASPVDLVDVDSQYPTPQDTYDGLHPNNIGEYAIAGAFAASLSTHEGIGAPIPASVVPTSVVVPSLATPTGLTAVATSAGTVTLTWDHVFGATGYDLYAADLTKGQSMSLSSSGVGADGDVRAVLYPGDTYEFAVSSEFGSASSPISTPVTLITIGSP